MPTVGGSTPAEWMKLTGQLVDAGTVSADLNGFAAVALRWRHEPDAAVAMLVVVPIHERAYPQAGLCHALEWPPGGSPAGINRSAGLRLQGVEKRLRVGVVVADPWSGERSEHTQLLKSGFQGRRPHGVAIVGMEDQRLAAALPDPLPQTSAADENSGDLRLLPIGHILSHHFSVPDVDHQIEVQPDTTDAGGQVGDVPTPHLIGAPGLQPRHRTGLLGRTGPATTMHLAVGMEHPVEAPL